MLFRKYSMLLVLAIALAIGSCHRWSWANTQQKSTNSTDAIPTPPSPSSHLFPIPVRKDYAYQWGYMNQLGQIVISPQFDRAASFSEGLAVVALYREVTDSANIVHAETKFGYIDPTGKIVIPAKFDYARSFSDGLAAVQVGQKWGYIDKTGKFVVPPRYDLPEEFVSNFSEGRAAVWLQSQQDRWGYLDKTGKLVIPAQFEAAGTFSEGLAVVQQGGKLGFIDRTGKFVVQPKFSSAGTFPPTFSQGLVPVEMDGNQAAIEQGRVVVGGQWGYADRSGKLAIPPQFQMAHPFSEGLAPVLVGGKRDWNMIEGGKWGYIDRTGKFVIQPQFDRAYPFSEGRAVVSKGRSCGYIDRTGKFTIKPRFKTFSCTSFYGGLASIESDVFLNGSMIDAYIDQMGRIIWQRKAIDR